ncbi:hypothetical protein GYH30_024671 [Glycine max]|nr:hypothetical protein GYH30_024671 [Glycine max]
MRKLDRLSRRVGVGNNNYVDDRIQSVWKEYEEVLVQEEILRFQKSRPKWLLAFGDHNSNFFHCTTVIRRRKNKMDMLQNDSEEWVSDEDQMQELVTNFYKKLFEDDNEDE